MLVNRNNNLCEYCRIKATYVRVTRISRRSKYDLFMKTLWIYHRVFAIVLYIFVRFVRVTYAWLKWKKKKKRKKKINRQASLRALDVSETLWNLKGSISDSEDILRGWLLLFKVSRIVSREMGTKVQRLDSSFYSHLFIGIFCPAGFWNLVELIRIQAVKKKKKLNERGHFENSKIIENRVEKLLAWMKGNEKKKRKEENEMKGKREFYHSSFPINKSKDQFRSFLFIFAIDRESQGCKFNDEHIGQTDVRAKKEITRGVEGSPTMTIMTMPLMKIGLANNCCRPCFQSHANDYK